MRTYHPLNTMLGSGIGDNIQSTLESDERGDVDNFSITILVEFFRSFLACDSTSSGQHVFSGISSDGEYSVHVDLDDFVPVVRREVFDGMTTLNTT